MEEQKVKKSISLGLNRKHLLPGESLEKSGFALGHPQPRCSWAHYIHLYSVQDPKQRSARAQRKRAGGGCQRTWGCWGGCRPRPLGWAWPIRLR